MASKDAITRLRKELKRLKKDPVENIVAVPLEENILEWHYLLEGPAGSPYEGGYYHGRVVFPKNYPYKPPSIYMITPNGRFQTNTTLCLSMSDFHPESWNPLWSVASILTGLLSFMLEDTPTYGSIQSSDQAKRVYAKRSLAENVKNPTFNRLFPQYYELYLKQQKETEQLNAKATHHDNPVLPPDFAMPSGGIDDEVDHSNDEPIPANIEQPEGAEVLDKILLLR